jgi:hypothetical protein
MAYCPNCFCDSCCWERDLARRKAAAMVAAKKATLAQQRKRKAGTK